MRQVVTRAVARTGTIPYSGLLLRQFLALGVVVLVAWLLRDRIVALDLHEIKNAVQAVAAYQWGLALSATAVSFWAIGRYDDIIHGLLATGLTPQSARWSGATAVAIAQFTGFGVFTGALVRWRMVPQLTLAGAFRISAAVSGSFLVGWAILTAAATLLFGGPDLWARAAATGLATTGLLALTVPVLLSRWPAQLPSVLAMARILGIAAVDLGFAALAFYVLLPPALDVPAGAFVLAFLIASMTGLIAGTPGGIGAFELAFLTQLPMLRDEPVIAAALAFRLVYHALPAGFAALALLRGPSAEAAETVAGLVRPKLPDLSPRLMLAIWNAPSAEARLLLQGDFGLIGGEDRPEIMACETGQSMVMLGQPLNSETRAQTALACLAGAARQKSRSPMVYKAPPRLAASARALGWRAVAIARDALLRPEDYAIQGPRYRQLRRMLNHAARKDIEVCEAGRNLPLDEMARLAAVWAGNQGGERGFSMGRFDPAYVSGQRVFLARRHGDLIGFVTFNETRNQWALDLMRHGQGAPTGTMHLLVHEAILAAKDARVPHLSLAALQYGNPDLPWFLRLIDGRLRRASGAEGLIRFKNTFAPRWQTLYALSPSRVGLAIGLADVARRIHH